jgi:hypothetical protein
MDELRGLNMSQTNLFVAGLMISAAASQPAVGHTLSEQARRSGGEPVRTVRIEDVPK